MSKSLRSTDHVRLIAILTRARKDAGLTQAQVADKLGKPQSFVAKYENGERRLDVVEFVAIARTMGADPLRLFKALLKPNNQPTAKSGKKAASAGPRR